MKPVRPSSAILIFLPLILAIVLWVRSETWVDSCAIGKEGIAAVSLSSGDHVFVSKFFYKFGDRIRPNYIVSSPRKGDFEEDRFDAGFAELGTGDHAFFYINTPWWLVTTIIAVMCGLSILRPTVASQRTNKSEMVR